MQNARYEFSNHHINKLSLLLRKSVYPYEDMNDGEKFDETSLPNKEDSRHPKRVWKDLKTKNIGDCHNLFV